MLNIKINPISHWTGEENKNPKPSSFRQTYSNTKKILEYELWKLRAIESSVALEMFIHKNQVRSDGALRADAKPFKPGVILSFTRIKKQFRNKITQEIRTETQTLTYPCDAFDDWQDNLRAIALSLEALRKVERYGVFKYEDIVQRLALPSAEGRVSTRKAAAEFIAQYSKLPADKILIDAIMREKAYKQAATVLHPDSPNFNGNPENFIKLQEAKRVLEN